MDGLVLAEALLPGEAFPADVTHKGLDLCVRHLVVPEGAAGGEGAFAVAALKRCLLQAVGCLVDAELPQQSELPVALVAAQQLVGVLLLRVPQLVGQRVFLQRLGLVETFVAGVAGERLDMTGHVSRQLMFLVVAFVTELAEEALLLVQLPPPLPLQLLHFFLASSCVGNKL